MTWIKVGTLPGFDFSRALRGEKQKQAGIRDKSWSSTLSKAVQSVCGRSFPQCCPKS
jgi:hypothetical protein